MIFHHHLKHTQTHTRGLRLALLVTALSTTKRSFPVMARRAWVMQLQSDKSKEKIRGCAETECHHRLVTLPLSPQGDPPPVTRSQSTPAGQ